MKRILAGVVLLTLCLGLFAGCQQPQTQAGDAEYTVTIVDGEGQPYASGIIVKILKDGQQVAMQPVNGQGQVKKTLPKADYTVELQFTAGSEGFYYDQSQLTLSAEKTQLQVAVMAAISGEGETVFDSKGQSQAYSIGTGSTYVKLVEGQRNYFLFAPKTAGTYSLTTSDPKAVIGQYGYTAYIQDNSISKVEDNVMTISVSKSMVGPNGVANPYVIGVDANGITDCVVTIKRTGEPQQTIEDVPLEVYVAKEELTKYTMPAGTLQKFDITAAAGTYELVLSLEDGFYHLNSVDGPIVMVNLGSESTFTDGLGKEVVCLDSIQSICTTTGVGKYFKDADGNYVKREDYTQCLQDYCGVMDEVNGVYPLTEDLKYIIQNHGEYVGWWNPDSPGFIFEDENENKLVGLSAEYAWLFLCCYLEPAK